MEFVDRKYVHQPTYYRLTDGEIEEIKTMCERLQEIFIGTGYSIDTPLTVSDSRDITIVIHNTVTPYHYNFL